MDTLVQIKVIAREPEATVLPLLERAFAAFTAVEATCSRFSPASELSRLAGRVGEPVPVSDLLFEALRFALEVAEATQGAFDPTVGGRLASYGFDRNYRTGERLDTGIDPALPVSYRDIELDAGQRTVRLRQPLQLDLGAVAKGLAIDLAARELAPLRRFVVEAGGDLYASGHNDRDEPWTIGIQHPLRPGETICALRLTDTAVCTSGSYARPSPLRAATHHLIDPGSGLSRLDLLSCTVVAPGAMLADALSTAAFVLGPERGMAFLTEAGVDGLCIDASLQLQMTTKIARHVV